MIRNISLVVGLALVSAVGCTSVNESVPPPTAIAPFSSDQAQQHQRAWAEYLGETVEKEIVLGQGADGREVTVTMVLVPPGEFSMGSSEDEQEDLSANARQISDWWLLERLSSEGPQHRVKITQPFFVSRYEVTQAQWLAVMGNNPSEFKGDLSHPVEHISWNDGQIFISKLNERAASRGMSFAMPTEAQWEHACRAGTTTLWHFGNSEKGVTQYGWINANAEGRTHPVGLLEPNAFGIHDLVGNVWEWCADWHKTNYYTKEPVDDPSGPPNGSRRTGRGGGWRSSAWHCRSATRPFSTPNSRSGDLGFRLISTLIRESD